MKTPRVSDFYPDAKVPKLKSSLDKMPTIQKPPLPATKTVSPAKPEKPKITAPKASRRFIKRTFDIYLDQLEFLRNLAFKGRLEGGEDSSVNAMVREALDEWIVKRKPN